MWISASMGCLGKVVNKNAGVKMMRFARMMMACAIVHADGLGCSVIGLVMEPASVKIAPRRVYVETVAFVSRKQVRVKNWFPRVLSWRIPNLIN